MLYKPENTHRDRYQVKILAGSMSLQFFYHKAYRGKLFLQRVLGILTVSRFLSCLVALAPLPLLVLGTLANSLS